MAKGRKQYKVVQQQLPDGLDQNDIMNMFQQLMGDPSKLDKEIVASKYKRLRDSIECCNKILLLFKKAILDQLHTKINIDPFYDREVKNLVDFVEAANEYINTETNDENRVHIYLALKESFVVEEYLKICKNLKCGSDDIKDKANLSDKFIMRFPGNDYFIFGFSKINFKHLFNHILEENVEPEELDASKKYILMVCNMLWEHTQSIYSIISSPDVDIDRLSEMIVSVIGEAKKQIPRCDRAFKIIADSVDTLKANMNDYYKEFVTSGNPATMFENFIRDVSSEMNMDKQTLMQFRRITMFLRKKAEQMPKKPEQLDTVFGMIDKIMTQLEDS
jgi:hypothetical protein